MSIKNKIIIRKSHGFFSDFLTAVAGIIYCTRNKSDFYIDWINGRYQNSGDTQNLFDKYFYQKLDNNNNFDNIYYDTTPIGWYFDQHINYTKNEDFYNLYIEPATILKEYNILNNKIFEDIDKNYFKNKKVLGVHRRGTDHAAHGEIISDVEFIKKIYEYMKLDNYEKIFLITDDLNSFEFFKKELGDCLIYTDSYKSSINGVHCIHHEQKNKIAEDVIRDAYLLSLTDHKIVTKSNVSTFSIICNLQKNNFSYIDNHITYK